ncbi:hypothetical protein TL16_g12760 [Triparma laevis f. inornata]|uniref:Uncharacterized protein n=1 Tax=Triparma laevis f. inornata TaxID=1714386 RepID=A0A9W7EXY8_9STRA|nr:hypothetical protein TL16_g12760 [Triparma laevis f. inornata]
MVSKPWQRIAEEKIDEEFESGALAFHDGSDVGVGIDDDEFWEALESKREPVKQVIFLLNITQVGEYACTWANLVVVDIPEGVESIGGGAFLGCRSLTTVSFPTTLTLIGEFTFNNCTSLENVDLLHTNLQELGEGAFHGCSELKSMTIPDSLQTLGEDVFYGCPKLVPSSIDVNESTIDSTSEVVGHLRSQMSLNALLSRNNFLNTDNFRRLIVPYLSNDALMTIRLASNPWSRVTDAFISDGVESGTMIVRGEEDMGFVSGSSAALKERHKLVTRVIFLLDITKVGHCACYYAVNLVVVDIPDGVESIELKSMTILDSLQTLGEFVFWQCSKLVSSSINVSSMTNDTTSEVVAYLHFH